MHLNQQQHLDLHQRISEAVAQDDVYSSTDSDYRKTADSLSKSAKPKAAAYYKPAAGLAIAASLVVAMFVGFQPQMTDIASETSQPVSSSLVSSSPVLSSPIEVQPAINEVAKVDNPAVIEPELKELDAEGQKRLRAYLNQHDAMARMRQGTQLVNYSKPREK